MKKQHPSSPDAFAAISSVRSTLDSDPPKVAWESVTARHRMQRYPPAE